MDCRSQQPVRDTFDPRCLDGLPVGALITVHPAVLGFALRLVGDDGLTGRVRAAMQADPGLVILESYLSRPVSMAVARVCLGATLDAARRAAADPSPR